VKTTDVGEAVPQSRSRALLFLILLICTVPLVLAWYLAGHPELIPGQSNYGRLIMPPLTVDYGELPLLEAGGKPGIDELKGRWGLVYLAGGSECLTACRDTVEKTRRIWLLLNKDLSRVRRVLLTIPPGFSAEALESLHREDPTLLLGPMEEALWNRLSPGLGGAENGAGRLMIMDPLGNIMMQYPADFDPYGVLKDLMHLLKASQIG
jgi:hypothetical protein